VFGSSGNTSRVASPGRSRQVAVTAKHCGKLPLQSLPEGDAAFRLFVILFFAKQF